MSFWRWGNGFFNLGQNRMLFEWRFAFGVIHLSQLAKDFPCKIPVALWIAQGFHRTLQNSKFLSGHALVKF